MSAPPDAHAVLLASDRVEFETLLSNISAQLVAADPDRLEETLTSALGT